MVCGKSHRQKRIIRSAAFSRQNGKAGNKSSGFADSFVKSLHEGVEDVIDNSSLAHFDLGPQTHTRQQIHFSGIALEFAGDLQSGLITDTAAGFTLDTAVIVPHTLLHGSHITLEGILGNIDHFTVKSSALLEGERIQFQTALVSQTDPADIPCRNVDLGNKVIGICRNERYQRLGLAA